MPYSHGTGFASSDGSNAPATRALIRNGASIDITFGDRGVGPLHLLASSDADPATMEVLLAAGSDPRRRDADGRTPLDVARARLDEIRAYDDSIRELRTLISLLDVPPKQVSIRLERIQTTVGEARSFGIDYSFTSPSGDIIHTTPPCSTTRRRSPGRTTT